MSYKNINIRRQAGSLGATVEGVDLSAPLDTETMDEIKAAWLDHLVLFFRDQEITPEQFKSFVSNVGDIEIHPFIEKIEGDDLVEGLDIADPNPWAPSTAKCHIDVSMMEVPTKGAALYAIDVGEAGGDTIWVNTYAAYEALSDSMKEFVASQRGLFVAMHRNALDQIIKMGPAAADVAKGFLQRTSEHPLVHTHPETGRKALFVDGLFLWSIVDLHPDESDMLKDYLLRHIAKPEFQCRFHWRPGSLALWDNRCTMHQRVDDAISKHRIMHRLPIKGTTAPTL